MKYYAFGWGVPKFVSVDMARSYYCLNLRGGTNLAIWEHDDSDSIWPMGIITKRDDESFYLDFDTRIMYRVGIDGSLIPIEKEKHETEECHESDAEEAIVMKNNDADYKQTLNKELNVSADRIARTLQEGM